MKTINDITQINTNKSEGRLLLTAMAVITGTVDKTLDQVLDEVSELSEEMFAETI